MINNLTDISLQHFVSRKLGMIKSVCTNAHIFKIICKDHFKSCLNKSTTKATCTSK